MTQACLPPGVLNLMEKSTDNFAGCTETGTPSTPAVSLGWAAQTWGIEGLGRSSLPCISRSSTSQKLPQRGPECEKKFTEAVSGITHRQI